MRTLFLFLLLLLMAAVRAGGVSHTAEKPPRLLLVGDSTIASYDKPPPDRPDLTGWGQVFGEFFAAGTEVVNRAQSGASSKSFITTGRWQKALEGGGDYVFVQFGHNDQPGKGDRSTDANSDYRDYLKRYIDEARTRSGRSW